MAKRPRPLPPIEKSNKNTLRQNRYVLSLRILEVLEQEHHSTKNAILNKLGLCDSDFDGIVEQLREKFLDEELEECGCCGCYHRKGYYGECRNDAERF